MREMGDRSWTALAGFLRGQGLVASNIFEPFIVGKTVKLHPLAILLAVALGLAIAGILGALVATPIVAVGGAVLGFLRERSGEPQQA